MSETPKMGLRHLTEKMRHSEITEITEHLLLGVCIYIVGMLNRTHEIEAYYKFQDKEIYTV